MLFNCGVGEDSWESLGMQGNPTINPKEINPEYSLEGLLLKLKLNTLATWCKELTHWKRPWCWERLKSGGEGDDRGWDDWMASLTWWTWVWITVGNCWWTGKPSLLQSMGHKESDMTEWTELNWIFHCLGIISSLFFRLWTCIQVNFMSWLLWIVPLWT